MPFAWTSERPGKPNGSSPACTGPDQARKHRSARDEASWMETSSFLESFQALRPVQAATIDKHERGLAVPWRYGLPVSDAMIAAAALEAGAGTV